MVENKIRKYKSTVDIYESDGCLTTSRTDLMNVNSDQIKSMLRLVEDSINSSNYDAALLRLLCLPLWCVNHENGCDFRDAYIAWCNTYLCDNLMGVDGIQYYNLYKSFFQGDTLTKRHGAKYVMELRSENGNHYVFDHGDTMVKRVYTGHLDYIDLCIGVSFLYSQLVNAVLVWEKDMVETNLFQPIDYLETDLIIDDDEDEVFFDE